MFCRKGVLGDGWEAGLAAHLCAFLQLSQARLLTSSVPAYLLRLYQLLLFTLPGTPVFNYGDEIGLQAADILGQVVCAASPAQCGRSRPSTMVLRLSVDRPELWGGTAFDFWAVTKSVAVWPWHGVSLL